MWAATASASWSTLDAVGGHHRAAVGDRERRRGRRRCRREPRSLPMRPQYGSSPYHEHFVSWLRAMARAPRSASSSDAAPDHLDPHHLGGALGVAAICAARLKHASATAPASSSSSTGPARPRASRITVSLVDVQPSLTSRLKLASTPACSTCCSAAGLGGGVGGEHGQHRGHVRRQHRRALGHAADGEARAARPATSLGTVSVVMMARAASGPPSGERAAASGRDAGLHDLDREAGCR